MTYVELYDLENGGLLEDFASQDEALLSLRDMAAESGIESIRGLSLVCVVDEKRSLIARDEHLVEMVARMHAGAV